ncbi:recombinase RecO [Spirochaetia bacterium]|nr:recombinase RecO [Spirochaetia bacterium]
MPRTYTYSALVLRVKPSGESNRDAWILTAEEGVIRATVFGGPKSKLRAHVAPFNRGTLWVYHDPVRDSRKVTDFDVRIWRPGIREGYDRSMAAAAVAETILAAHGSGGSWEAALALADAALDALEGAEEAACLRIVIHFLWNWAELIGSRPELDRCASCGKGFAVHNGERPLSGETLWYSKRDGTVLCPSCAGLSVEELPVLSPEMAADFLPLSPGTRRWLTTVENLNPALLARFSMDRASGREAKALVTAILTEALGKRLSTWDW